MKPLVTGLAILAGLLLLAIGAVDWATLEHRVTILELQQPCPCPCNRKPEKPALPKRRTGDLGDLPGNGRVQPRDREKVWCDQGPVDR